LEAPKIEYRSARFDLGDAEALNLSELGFDLAIEVYNSDYEHLTEEYGEILVR